MKKWIFPVLLLPINAVSLTGGLLVQRKWRPAIMIAGAVTLLGIADLLTERIAIWFLTRDSEALEVYHWLLYVHLAYFLLIALAVVVSSLTLFRHTERTGGSLLHAAAATLMMFLALTTAMIVNPDAARHIRDEILTGGRSYAPVKSREAYDAIRFHHDINLKDAVLWGKPTLRVPSGAHKITGIVRYQGKPAVVSVQLFLNRYWRTRTVKTDQNGRFVFHVGPKDLALNRIELDWWFNKPQDNKERMAIIAHPSVEYADMLFDHARYQEQIPLAPETPESAHDIEIEIVDFIPMIWPQFIDEVQQADPQTTALEWERIPGADHYRIKIAHYTDEHSARPHLSTRAEDNTLPLSALPLKPASIPSQYYVEIEAFDKADRFLASSRDGFGRMRFTIPGYEIIGNAPPPGKCN